MKVSWIRGILTTGFGLLLIFSAGCEPVATNAVAEFSRDFVRSLVAALLL